MSNEDWDGPAMLMLPASVARAMQGDSPPGHTYMFTMMAQSYLSVT